MVLFLPNEFAIRHFITLVAHKPIQRRNNSLEVNAFWNRVDSILAFGAAVKIVRAFEDEAQALWHEPDIASFAPAEQVQRYLSEPIVLAHIVHGITPSLLCAIER